MHETRAVAEILRAAEAAAQGKRIASLAIRLEGDDHLTPALVRTQLEVLSARTHPGMEVVVDVDRDADRPGIRLVAVRPEG